MEVVVLSFTTAFYAFERDPAFIAATQWGRGGIDVVEVASLFTGSCCLLVVHTLSLTTLSTIPHCLTSSSFQPCFPGVRQ